MAFDTGTHLGDIPDALLTIFGAAAQISLGRRLRVPRAANYAIVGAIVAVSFWHRIAWLSAAAMFWWVFLILSAAALMLHENLSDFRPDRRELLRTSAMAVCAAPAIALGIGVITRKDFHVKEIDIKFPNLPKDLEGLRLLHLSDIHVGSFFSVRDVARAVDISNHLQPDLAFITGDLITNKRDPLDACLFELRRLRAHSGTWGCMGNHELYSKVQTYTQSKARCLGICFLRREAASLKFGDHRINLVGVDYQRFRQPYLEGVDELISPGSFNILLSHNPDVFPIAAQKRFDLTLAGHTHGGQVNVEILGENLNIADFYTRYTRGLYQLPGSSVYVNSGLGTIGVPVRLGAPPEIALIRLCSS